jgi:hypothetical protein
LSKNEPSLYSHTAKLTENQADEKEQRGIKYATSKLGIWLNLKIVLYLEN